MLPISNALQSPAAASGVKETPKVQRTEDTAQDLPLKSVRDEYIPEEKPEPIGRYWMEKDEGGRPRICFDAPERAEGAPGQEKVPPSDRTERCVCDTDGVDREIELLKKKLEALGRQLGTETDETRISQLEKECARLENELSQKDNDAYRRLHADFS